MWQQVGLPNGPSTWDELRRGGAEIKAKQKVPVGIGMSQEIDSNKAGRARLWSYGGAIQDEREQVILDSPETVAAVTYMKGLFEDAMTNEVFAWNPASNNQALLAGKLSYIVNSISAYRTMQQVNPKVAEDVFFVRALEGPTEAVAAQHVMYNWLVPEHASNAGAAQEFLLHYTANFARATWESELYDLPAFTKLVPQLGSWLDDDPFGSKPADKLAVLKDALDWTTNVGHRGYANSAIGEVFGTFVIPSMYARAARGRATPQEAVQRAEGQIKPIFRKWRTKGLIGGA
jgi:multiple sugar transport system substrate-binding protein